MWNSFSNCSVGKYFVCSLIGCCSVVWYCCISFTHCLFASLARYVIRKSVCSFIRPFGKLQVIHLIVPFVDHTMCWLSRMSVRYSTRSLVMVEVPTLPFNRYFVVSLVRRVCMHFPATATHHARLGAFPSGGQSSLCHTFHCNGNWARNRFD